MKFNEGGHTKRVVGLKPTRKEKKIFVEERCFLGLKSGIDEYPKSRSH